MRDNGVLCSPELLQARDAHFSRLTALFGGQPLDSPFYLQGFGAKANADPYAEPERWVEEGLQSLAERADALKVAQGVDCSC
jgi:hypothetical protein